MHCLVARPFRAICTHLYPQRFCLRPALLSNSRRSFAHSPALFRNKSKAPTKTTDAVAEEDPLDFSKLQNGIATAVSRLKDDLSKFRAGGRFNTATLESLRVHLSNDSKESVRLGDLAQVVPRGGRTVTILATEDDHIKPITSAIGSSSLSLNPQADPHNALQLNITIPPPTKESRDQSVHAAKQAFERAASAVRDSRGTMHKHLQEMQKKRMARPDDVRKAHDQMEKTTAKGQKEIKDLFEAAKRTLEQA